MLYSPAARWPCRRAAVLPCCRAAVPPCRRAAVLPCCRAPSPLPPLPPWGRIRRSARRTDCGHHVRCSPVSSVERAFIVRPIAVSPSVERAAMSYVFVPHAVSTGPAPGGTRRLAWRWAIALAAVLALHVAGFLWFERYRDAFAPETVKPPVQVALLTPQPIARDTERAHRTGSASPAPSRPSP